MTESNLLPIAAAGWHHLTDGSNVSWCDFLQGPDKNIFNVLIQMIWDKQEAVTWELFSKHKQGITSPVLIVVAPFPLFIVAETLLNLHWPTGCICKLFSKQFPVHSSSRYGAVLSFFWSLAGVHLLNLIQYSIFFSSAFALYRLLREISFSSATKSSTMLTSSSPLCLLAAEQVVYSLLWEIKNSRRLWLKAAPGDLTKTIKVASRQLDNDPNFIIKLTDVGISLQVNHERGLWQ